MGKSVGRWDEYEREGDEVDGEGLGEDNDSG